MTTPGRLQPPQGGNCAAPGRLQLTTPGEQSRPYGRLLRLPEVRALTGLSTSTVYRMGNAGTFPKPIRLSKRATAWVEAEVTAWIAERIAASRETGLPIPAGSQLRPGALLS
jgi:prophage regulatory protein